MALRLTVQVQLVVQALLRDPAREMYGLELSEETGLQPGTAAGARLPVPAAGGARGLGGEQLGGHRPAGGETSGPPVLPPDGRRRGPGRRCPRGGAAP